MPKSQATGRAVSNASQSNRYNPIPEGIYYGVISALKWGTFSVEAGYSMEKLTPELTLFNAEGTVIDRQDFTIGAIDDAGNYTAEFFNKDDASVIFGGYDMTKGNFGARNLMFSLAMLNGDGVVNFNEDAIVDVVVRVQIKNRSYVWNNQTRHENVVTRFDTVGADDYEALAELGVETHEWVTRDVVVLAQDGDRMEESARLVFSTEAAYAIWEDLFYTGTDEWQNGIGELGDTYPENWDEWTGLFAEAEEIDIEAEKVALLAELNSDAESDDSVATVEDLPM